MADFDRLDEELNALAAGLDVDAMVAAVPKFEGLDAVDAALEAFGANMPPDANVAEPTGENSGHKANPNTTSEVEASEVEASEVEASEVEDAEADTEERPEAPSALSNFRAGLTPSDVQQLAETEAETANADEGPLSTLATGDSSSDGESAEAAEEIASVKEPSAPSSPPRAPEPIFKEEDLAAIRASTPPPPGADVVEVDVADVDVLEMGDLEIDDLDFVEFADDDDAVALESTDASTDATGAENFEAPAHEETEDGDADHEKKGFFKKIFG